MLSLYSSLLPKVEGGLERPQRGAKGPPELTEEQSRRESGGHLFPRPQGLDRARGRDFTAPPHAGLQDWALGGPGGGPGGLRKRWVPRLLAQSEPQSDPGIRCGGRESRVSPQRQAEHPPPSSFSPPACWRSWMRREAPVLLELLFFTTINEPQVSRVLRIPLRSWVRKKEAGAGAADLGGRLWAPSPQGLSSWKPFPSLLPPPPLSKFQEERAPPCRAAYFLPRSPANSSDPCSK